MYNLYNLFQKLKHNDFRRILKNITNFSLFQLTNYLVPLLTIPYIVRVIGTEKFGIISFIQGIIYYFYIIVDYGFDISGTQKIAQQRQSPNELNKTFISILIIKIALMIICIIILYILSIVFVEIQKYSLIYLFSFLFIPAQILSSIWFYAAMENTKYLNYINLISRSAYLIGIFLFIKEQNDFIYIPAVHSGSLLLGGIVSFGIILNIFKIYLKVPKMNDIIYLLKDGWHVFISNLSIAFYRNSNVVILGFFASKEIVGIYSAGERIIKILQWLFFPIYKVMYPYISRHRIINYKMSIKYIKYMIVSLGSFTLPISIILILFAQPISILILGNEFIRAATVIKICGFAVFFSMINYILGIIFMLNFNMKKQFLKSVFFTGVINIVISSTLSYLWLEKGTAIGFLSAEFFLSLFITFFIYKEFSSKKINI